MAQDAASASAPSVASARDVAVGPEARAEAERAVAEGAADPVYGSSEVRERLYLFLWALLQERYKGVQ